MAVRATGEVAREAPDGDDPTLPTDAVLRQTQLPVVGATCARTPEVKMTLPFTIEQFLDVFRRYNDGVWPRR